MTSHTTERFRKLFADLPSDIKKQAREAFAKFQNNPYHPGLRFKRVHSQRAIYSVRISINYRALGVQQDGEMIWFWIGSHTDYDNVLKKLR